MQIVKEQFKIAYDKFKLRHKNKIVIALLSLFAVVVFLLGWMISKWPKGQWPRR